MLSNQIFRNKVIQIAIGEDNTLTKTMPEEIQKYRDSVGIGRGADWCVAFIYWCYENAAGALGAYNPMLKTASCGRLYSFAREHDLFVDYPEVGDIYISRGKDHAGLIWKSNPNFADKDARTETIEGNTWVDNHVWGVHKRRKKLQEAHFIRI